MRRGIIDETFNKVEALTRYQNTEDNLNRLHHFSVLLNVIMENLWALEYWFPNAEACGVAQISTCFEKAILKAKLSTQTKNKGKNMLKLYLTH